MNKKRIVMGLASLAEKREEILVGNIGGKYWWEILVGNIGGKYWWEILVGNNGGKYWWEIIYISIVDTQKRATK
jgi:hypothetical protein